MIRLHNHRLRAGVVAIFGLAASLFSPLIGGFGAHFASAAPLGSMPTVSITVPAGGRASLEVQGFAFQPGAALPQGPLSLAQQPFPSDKIRTALYYGVNWGYAQTKPDQVALAIWWTQDNNWLSDNHTVAESIANAAASAPGLPSWNANGRPIPTLAAQGKLLVSDLSLKPGTLSPTAGSGALVLQNTGTQDIVVNLPYGTLFTGASGSAIIWSVGVAQAAPVAQNTPKADSASPTSASTPQSGSTSGAEATPASKEAAPTAAVVTSNPTSEATATQTVPNDTSTTVGSTQAPPASSTDAAANQPGKPTTNQGASKPVQTKPDSPKQVVANSPAPAQSGKSSTESPQAAGTGNEAAGSDVVINAESAPPLPLNTPTASTGASGSPAPPAPVATGQPGVNQAPPPNLTVVATLPADQGKATPTEAKKEGTTPTTASKAEPTEPPKVNPTPVATSVPVPPPGPLIVPTIVAGADGGVNNQVQPLPGEGSPPKVSPTTGAGASPVPVWLTLLSTMMVLGGWTLKRMSNLRPELAVIRVEAPTIEPKE